MSRFFGGGAGSFGGRHLGGSFGGGGEAPQIGTPVALGNNGGVGGSSTTVTLTTTANAPAGAAIIVGVYAPSTTISLLSVADSAGNTYAIDASRVPAALARRVYIASCPNPVNLPLGGTITATYSASLSGIKNIAALSCSGLLLTGAFDKSSGNDANSNTWSTGTTAALAQANELAVAFACSSSGTASTTAAPFDELADFSTNRCVLAYDITTATTGVSATGTWGANEWAAVVATYKGRRLTA